MDDFFRSWLGLGVRSSRSQCHSHSIHLIGKNPNLIEFSAGYTSRKRASDDGDGGKNKGHG